MLILTLYANALSCAGFGLLFLILPTAVSNQLGEAPKAVLMVIGAGLLINAALLLVEARRTNPRRNKVMRFVVGDALWVAISLMLIVTNTWVTTTGGTIWTILVALFVGGCGALQYLNLPEKQKPQLATVQPVVHSPKRFKRPLVWFVGAPIAGTLLILALVFGVHAIRQAIYAANVELPGKMTNVNGAELYVNCQGRTTARTIILENGMGLASENWDWVQRELAQNYHVCSYDRAGVGFSHSPKDLPDAGQSADSLAALLEQINVTEPVILVAHSYGGLIARIFADRYPEQTAGLVLVDSSHEDMGARIPPEFQAEFDKMLNGFSVLSKLNRFAGAHVIGIVEKISGGLDHPAKARAKHLYGSSRHMAGSAAEASGWDVSTELARGVAKRGLGSLPLRVMMVDGWPKEMAPSWHAMQSDLSALSQDSALVIVPAADHFNVLTDQGLAGQVTSTVRTLAKQVF